MTATVLSIIAGLIGLVTYFFVKSPEQKVADDRQKQEELDRELSQAMDRVAKERDPTDLSKLINK